MVPDNITNSSSSMGSYVPYFYQAGLYLWSPHPGKNGPAAPKYASSGVYDFTSDLTSKPFFPQSQTVEQIIQKGYLTLPPSDPELAIITDKQHTSRQGLDEVIRQVQDRQNLSQHIIDDLDQAKCSAVSNLYEQVAYQAQPPSSKQIYSLNKRLDDLYSQQRDERLNLWRDVTKIRLFVPEQAQSYLSSYRKVAMLNEPGVPL